MTLAGVKFRHFWYTDNCKGARVRRFSQVGQNYYDGVVIYLDWVPLFRNSGDDDDTFVTLLWRSLLVGIDPDTTCESQSEDEQ